MGRIGLINSGGESKGASDMADSVITAVVNKRAGGIITQTLDYRTNPLPLNPP
jgi:DhnA family fructose-bisphosphate aldolase class Ia